MEEQKIFYLTKEGLRKLQKEYESLKKIRLVKIKGETPKAWQSEDLNSEYLSFQEDLSFFEAKISELENILKNVTLIEAPPKDKRNIVGLGATITLEDTDGHLNEFIIVDTIEASPSEGRISLESPVGKAFFGKKIGDEVIINSPIKVVYRIKKVKYNIS